MSEYVSNFCGNCQKSKIPTSTCVRNTHKYTSTTTSLLQTMQPFQDLSSQTMFISVFVVQVDPFQDVSFQIISFSGGVFSDYILFKPCLVILYPFQHVPLLTISSSETSESRTFFFSASLTWIYETTDIKRKKHMRHPDIKIYETLVGTVFQQVS